MIKKFKKDNISCILNLAILFGFLRSVKLFNKFQHVYISIVLL